MFIHSTTQGKEDAHSMAGVTTALLCLPLYACVYGHVTPPSRQPRRAGISTFADMPRGAASVFGGKGNNLGAAKNVFGSLDLVYMSQTRKNFLEVL